MFICLRLGNLHDLKDYWHSNFSVKSGRRPGEIL